MEHRRCHNLECPDCHPEHWQPESNDHHALAWPYAAALLVLLVILAFVYVSGHPGP